MRWFSVFALFAFALSAFAQTPSIHSGSTVYIEPMGGYETYLSAAFLKKNVPVVIVTDRAKADFVVRSTISHRQASQPAVVVNNTNVSNGGNDSFNQGVQMEAANRAARGATSASISVVDRTSTQVVFAYSVGKAGNTNQVQSSAEACAKHFKEFIEKSERLKK